MIHVLKNKNIILGVTGSIAAYKAPILAREIVKIGGNVHCIMTESATQFTTPITMANITHNPVIINMFDKDTQQGGAWHIHLSHSCEAMIIAPCSATTIGKLANGIADNPLIAVALALPKTTPLLIAPAMDSTMWLHPATQRNVLTLSNDGVIIIPPEEGVLSSGLVGPGRLPEIDIIIDALANSFSGWLEFDKKIKHPKFVKNNNSVQEVLAKPVETLEESVEKDAFNAELELEKLKKSMAVADKIYKGKKVLITAGPTLEKIDDVRFISNRSSGKMGFALAEQALKLGAEVVLITGPVNLKANPRIKRIDVETADEMYHAAKYEFTDSNIAILSAAVADYTPANPQKGKIKKHTTGDKMTLELSSTDDILASLGQVKLSDQILVGFALETENEIENAILKLESKNCDFIVVNSANKPRSGFDSDDNTITIIDKARKTNSYPPMSKSACAEVIFKKISELIKSNGVSRE